METNKDRLDFSQLVGLLVSKLDCFGIPFGSPVHSEAFPPSVSIFAGYETALWSSKVKKRRDKSDSKSALNPQNSLNYTLIARPIIATFSRESDPLIRNA